MLTEPVRDRLPVSSSATADTTLCACRARAMATSLAGATWGAERKRVCAAPRRAVTGTIRLAARVAETRVLRILRNAIPPIVYGC